MTEPTEPHPAFALENLVGAAVHWSKHWTGPDKNGTAEEREAETALIKALGAWHAAGRLYPSALIAELKAAGPTPMTDERDATAEKEARHARRDELRAEVTELVDEAFMRHEDRFRQHEEARREERGRYERAAAIQQGIDTLEKIGNTNPDFAIGFVLRAAGRYAAFTETGEIA